MIQPNANHIMLQPEVIIRTSWSVLGEGETL